jgi:hypothetical protein
MTAIGTGLARPYNPAFWSDSASQMIALLQTILAGIVGFVGGCAALWAQQRFAWKPQKRIELRNKVFDDAMNALAMFESDALDSRLQATKGDHAGSGYVPTTIFRTETRVAMQKSLLQVRAFFSPEASSAFDTALRANVRLDNIPHNDDFAAKADRAVKLMAQEVGLIDTPSTQRLRKTR